MNDTLETYNALMILKRVSERNFILYRNLQNRIDKDSKNILVICKSVKACKEALKFIANDHLDNCKIHLNANKLEIEGKQIVFAPVSKLEDFLVGYKYKEYYFEEEFHI